MWFFYPSPCYVGLASNLPSYWNFPWASVVSGAAVGEQGGCPCRFSFVKRVSALSVPCRNTPWCDIFPKKFIKESIRKRCAHYTSHLYLQWMLCYQTSLLYSYKPLNFSYLCNLPKPQLQTHIFRQCSAPHMLLYPTYLFLSILSFCSEPYFTVHTILKLEFHQSYRNCFTQKTEFISSNSGRTLMLTLRY